MIAITLNLIGLVSSSLNIVITTSLCLFILLQPRHRRNLELFLSATTFFASLMLSLSLILLAVNALMHDFRMEDSGDSLMCRAKCSFLYVTISANYSGFCLQAISRLIHVVYRQHSYLRTFKAHLLAVIFSWILAILIMSPYLLIEQFVVYLPSENYCLIPLTNLSAMLYLTVPTFIIQFVIISLIYFRLAVFVHYSTVHNANREIAVVKRLFYTVLSISTVGIPSAIIWTIYICTHYFQPMSYRIQIFSYSIGFFMINVALIFINPRLYSLVFKRKRRVVPQDQPVVAQVPAQSNITIE